MSEDNSKGDIFRRAAFVFAMEVEGRAFAEQLGLTDRGRLDPDLPATWLEGDLPMADGGTLAVAAGFAGFDQEAGCDRVGTDAAGLATYLLCRRFNPDLLVNAGTCGGFQDRGANIGDVFIGQEAFLFHDRRIPIPRFREYGLGRIPAWPLAGLCEALSARPGVVSTGDSFESSPEEMAFFSSEKVVAKEMEAAAIARLAKDLNIPFVALKAVTDLVDHPLEASDEMFERNLEEVADILQGRLHRLVDWLADGQSRTKMAGD